MPTPHLNLLTRRLVDLEQRRIKRLFVEMPPRHGKQVSHATRVLTPSGYVRHGDLSPGGLVYHPSGHPVRVAAVSAETLATLRVRFSDGQEVVCHPNHEWIVSDRAHGSRAPLEVMETHALLESGVRLGSLGRGGRYRFRVPWTEPVEMPDQVLPLHPYALGVWLGDGKASGPTISHAAVDDPTVARVAAAVGYPPSSHWVHKDTGVHYAYFPKPFVRHLRALGVLHHKHVPARYLLASRAQRRELLQGLVDTDGHIDATGRVHFVNTNVAIIEAVEQLVRMEGMRTTRTRQGPTLSSNGIQGRLDAYTVSWTVDPRTRRRWRTIESIEPCAPEPGRCIQVESPDGAYLVGESLVPTHNSNLCSHFFPAWYLGRHPDHQVMLASYESTFAQVWGERARDVLMEFGPDVFGVGVHPKRNAAADWRIANNVGRMRCTGVAGGITGRGADLLIIDDPIKDAAEASSPVMRNRAWDWYSATARSRLEPNGIVIVIQTRWHQEDLIGRLRRQETLGGEQWESVTMKAICENPESDPMGRSMGQALWPARYDETALANIKNGMPSHWWNALYQQQPTPPGGAMAQTVWFKIIQANPHGEPRRCRFWDVGGDEKKRPSADPDWTVGAKVARYPDGLFVVEDIKRVQMSSANVMKLIVQTAMMDGHECVIREEQEGGSSGLAIINSRKKEFAGFNYAGQKPLGKPNGWIPMLIQAELGNVALFYGNWNEPFLAEVSDAPHGSHDDQLDSVAGAMHFLTIGSHVRASDLLSIGSSEQDAISSFQRKEF